MAPQLYTPEPLSNQSGLTMLWPRRLTIFSFVLFFFFLAGHPGFAFGYHPYVNKLIAERDAEIEELAQTIPKEDQENFLTFYSQLVNLKSILSRHPAGSRVFPYLESSTNQKVYFTRFDLDLRDKKATLDGVADSYDVLTEQLRVFEQSPEILSYTLGGVSQTGDRVAFGLTLILRSSLFDFQ